MMQGNGGHGKQQGVRHTTPKKRSGYEPNQVLGAVIGHVGLVTYSDENGVAHENLAFFIGGKAYMDLKGGEQWLREKLGVCQGPLGDQLEATYQRYLGGTDTGAVDASEVPAPSKVDIVRPASGTKERLTAAIEGGG